MPWLARATLDVIGEAGFGYTFNSLEAAAERRENESELARAFGVIFGTARKFRVMTILQVWFPVLRRFVRTVSLVGCVAVELLNSGTGQRRENATMQQATATMHRIGSELIEQRRAVVAAETSVVPVSEKSSAIEGDKTRYDRDLLSVLSKFPSTTLV